MRSRIAFVLAVVFLGGCVGMNRGGAIYGGQVKTIPALVGSSRPARPVDCPIEFVRTRPPEEAYDELAGLQLSGAWGNGQEEAIETMRAAACQAGADAVLIDRDWFWSSFDGGTISGTAIAFRDPRALARRREARRTAAKEAERQAAAERVRVAAERAQPSEPEPQPLLPDGYGPATVRRAATLRTGPDRLAATVAEIEPGTELWAAPGPVHGFHRVRLSDKRGGYLEAGALELGIGNPPRPGEPVGQGERVPPPVERTPAESGPTSI